jgi:hypothetical protein
MKKYLSLLACILLFAFAASAQEETIVKNENDSIKEKVNEPEKSSVFLDGSLNTDMVFFWKKKKTNEEHWSGSKFAFVNLDGLQGADIKQSKSYAITIMPIEVKHSFDSHWLFVSGTQLEWTRYHFSGNVGLQGKNDITYFEPAPEGFSYKSSKLLAYYVTLPLILEYQTKVSKNNTFYINGGVEGMLKYYSKSQVDIRTSQGIEKTSLGRDLNFSPVNARFVLQIGLNDVGIYGYYQPFSLFEKGKGPDVKSFGIGISLN